VSASYARIEQPVSGVVFLHIIMRSERCKFLDVDHTLVAHGRAGLTHAATIHTNRIRLCYIELSTEPAVYFKLCCIDAERCFDVQAASGKMAELRRDLQEPRVWRRAMTGSGR
jgi:hypothetical protein